MEQGGDSLEARMIGKSNPMYGKEPWNKGLTKDTDERVRKNAESNTGKKQTKEHRLHNRQSSIGKKLGPQSPEHKKKHSKSMLGKKHGSMSLEHKRKIGESRLGKKFGPYSPEHKKKLRLIAIKRVEENIKNGGQIHPFYNPEGCRLIDEYGKENGYNFQHAENGGEFRIKELGYWVDGYDEEKNIVIEIDESFHFDSEGNLSKRDIERQTEIEDFLKCKFIRIKI